MKNQGFILLSCLLMLACGGGKSETQTENIDSVRNATDIPASNSSENTLTIKGKDIWVRDEPGIGKLVMTLQDGDQCNITGYPKQFEIIRGQAHLWYPIEFKGKNGWVFGSQTNKQLDTKIIKAKNKEDLWIKFVADKKEHCKEYNSKNDPDDKCEIEVEGENWLVGKIETNSIVVTYSHMNPEVYAYFNNVDISSPFILYSMTSYHEGAMGWKTTDHFLSGFRSNKGDSIIFYGDVPESHHNAGEAFNGKIDHVFKITSDEFLVITYDEFGVNNDMAGGLNMSYKIYYLNGSNKTCRLISKVGQTEIMGSAWGWIAYNEDGIFADKIELRYLSENPPLIQLLEYRKKTSEIDGGIKIVPFDTLKTIYKYDAAKKIIVQQ